MGHEQHRNLKAIIEVKYFEIVAHFALNWQYKWPVQWNLSITPPNGILLAKGHLDELQKAEIVNRS